MHLVRPTPPGRHEAAMSEPSPLRPGIPARPPAIVIHVIEPDPDRDGHLCLVAFRLENGKWKQLDRNRPSSTH